MGTSSLNTPVLHISSSIPSLAYVLYLYVNPHHTSHNRLPRLRAILIMRTHILSRIFLTVEWSWTEGKKKTPRTATSLAYLNRIPRFTVRVPFPEPSHSTRRRACSSSLTSQSIVFFSVSMTTLSPSRTSAMGPPRRASGTTWPGFFCDFRFRFTRTGVHRDCAPMMKPRDAPEKRPSVISAVEPASPAPINAAVGPCIQRQTVTSMVKEKASVIRPSRV